MPNRFKLLFSSVWGFLKPLAAVFLSATGPILAKSAAAAVRSVEESKPAVPGHVKRESARQTIINDLKRQGIEVGAQVAESAVNAAIEAAVLGLQAEGK